MIEYIRHQFQQKERKRERERPAVKSQITLEKVFSRWG